MKNLGLLIFCAGLVFATSTASATTPDAVLSSLGDVVLKCPSGPSVRRNPYVENTGEVPVGVNVNLAPTGADVFARQVEKFDLLPGQVRSIAFPLTQRHSVLIYPATGDFVLPIGFLHFEGTCPR